MCAALCLHGLFLTISVFTRSREERGAGGRGALTAPKWNVAFTDYRILFVFQRDATERTKRGYKLNDCVID